MAEYVFPAPELLNDPDRSAEVQRSEFAARLNDVLAETLQAYKVKAHIAGYEYNDLAVIFRLKMAYGEPARRVIDLRNDLELRLGCPIETLPGNSGHVIVAAKSNVRPVLPLKQVIESQAFRQAESKLTVAVGDDLLGQEFLFDLNRVGNQLVVGTTGSGKSTYVNDIIMSILFRASPRDVRFIMIDPKKVELSAYNDLPHMLVPVQYGTEDALGILEWVLMEAQSRLLAVKEAGCEDLEEYNRQTGHSLAHIVVVMDEFMELMMQKPTKDQLEELVRQIVSRTARTGVHIILTTQRPTKEVISPKLKALVPCRAAFTVVDKRESRIAVFRTGAERLLGYGDMIYSEREDENAVHCQAAFVSYEEVDRVIEYIRTANAGFTMEPNAGIINEL